MNDEEMRDMLRGDQFQVWRKEPTMKMEVKIKTMILKGRFPLLEQVLRLQGEGDRLYWQAKIKNELERVFDEISILYLCNNDKEPIMNKEPKKIYVDRHINPYGDAAKPPQAPSKARRIYDLLVGVRSGIGKVNALARGVDERLLGGAPETDKNPPQPSDLGILDEIIAALCEFSNDLEAIAKRLRGVEVELKD